MGNIESLNHLTPAQRLQDFASTGVSTHPRQPLEDSVYGLQVGCSDEAELRVSDIQSVLEDVERLEAEISNLKGGLKGIQCECGLFSPFSAYVYAHMREVLLFTCPRCKRGYSVFCGIAKLKSGPKV